MASCYFGFFFHFDIEHEILNDIEAAHEKIHKKRKYGIKKIFEGKKTLRKC